MKEANLAAFKLPAEITERLVSVPQHLEGTSSREQLTQVTTALSYLMVAEVTNHLQEMYDQEAGTAVSPST